MDINAETLYICNKGLTVLPDLSKFTNLKKIYCMMNNLTEITYLPETLIYFDCSCNKIEKICKLPESLKEFYCNQNKLIVLPELPNGLTHLQCGHNNLLYLPKLSRTLEYLYCSYNNIKIIDDIPKTIKKLCCDNTQVIELSELHEIRFEHLSCYNTPLIHLTNSFCINKLNKVSNIIRKFKFLFYSLKYKNKLRDILWINIREKKIKELYSPANLNKLIENIEDEETLFKVLDSWV